jgi:hypothetical protein
MRDITQTTETYPAYPGFIVIKIPNRTEAVNENYRIALSTPLTSFRMKSQLPAYDVDLSALCAGCAK